MAEFMQAGVDQRAHHGVDRRDAGSRRFRGHGFAELLYIFVTNRNRAPMRKEKGSRRHWVYITVYA